MTRPADSKVLPSKPRNASSITTWGDEFEVIVVGFGVAGGAAAIEAARAGARTLILERQTRGGGATALSEGTIYFGGGTRVQKATGFEDTFDNMLAHVRAAAGPTADPEKVHLYCEQSLSHFDFFSSIGVEFNDTFFAEKVIFPPTDDCLIFSGNEESYPFSQEAKPVPRGHKPKKTGSAGAYIIEQMIDTATKLGVKIQNETRALTLVRDDAGRVVGVIARIEGAEVAIKATRGVILTTGGFIMNRAMVEHYAPDLAKCRYPIGSEGCDGSGIRMGMGVGGAAVNMHEGLMTTAFFPPVSHIKGILINAQGQRFINEDCYHGRVSRTMIDQPGDRVYLLLDSAHFDQPLDLAGITIAGTGDSWEEVEGELDMPAGALSATMDFYNRHAKRGRDPLFDKRTPILTALDQAPFVALELNFQTSYFSFFTLGGLKTSTDGEVLDRSGKPIAGLFAAGRCTSGLPAWGHGYSSGMSLADCTFFGRQAGRKAAAG